MSPSPSRQSSALATLNGKVLLFGGCESCGGSFGLMGDTWEWDGQSWTELHPAQSPPARFGAVAGTVAGKIVLFGGESYGSHALRRHVGVGRRELVDGLSVDLAERACRRPAPPWPAESS